MYNLSVNADALPPPLVGEALADRKVFANRHTLIANELSLPRAPLVGKTPPAGGGGTQVPKGERLSSECETERLYEEQLHLELTAIETLFVRVRVSLCFSFSSAGLALSGADAPAVPLFGFAIFPPTGGNLSQRGSPWQRGETVFVSSVQFCPCNLLKCCKYYDNVVFFCCKPTHFTVKSR